MTEYTTIRLSKAAKESAQEENDWSCNGERRYTVLVRFDQND